MGKGGLPISTKPYYGFFQRITRDGMVDMEMIKTPACFSTKYPIIDVEIKNESLDAQGRFDPRRGEICIVGFFIDDKITQFMLKDESKIEEFGQAVNDFLGTMNGKKAYAFNVNMEEGCFTELLGHSPRIYEIKPFRGRGATKEYFFKYLVKKKIETPDSICFKDPLDGRSKLCAEYWQKGRFEDVRKHNLCCLTKEAKILEHRYFIVKEFSPLIDRNDWLKPNATLPPV
ncbi:hypothetical protein GH153_00955 [bacterium]|nr:hypothetical protein [bacterium]